MVEAITCKAYVYFYDRVADFSIEENIVAAILTYAILSGGNGINIFPERIQKIDAELQKLIADFEAKRYELNMEMSKTDKDTDKLKELDGVIKNIYGEIMVNPNMAAFNVAKNEMDGLLNEINNVIIASANGEDPMTCPSKPTGCSGSCSSCGGCH